MFVNIWRIKKIQKFSKTTSPRAKRLSLPGRKVETVTNRKESRNWILQSNPANEYIYILLL